MPESTLIKPKKHGIFVCIALSSYGGSDESAQMQILTRSFTAVSLDVDSDRSGDSMRHVYISSE